MRRDKQNATELKLHLHFNDENCYTTPTTMITPTITATSPNTFIE